ncbi:aspartate kinase [Kandleria vitulina]|jgi:aspartate kinase|uniref:aspartate kinase n=1 Tax=Kandleria vitulina TaxID=1630 RepID=A0A1H2TDF5_9FIRM|nr:ACT domain-containing protein [Kandleria vitulina]SDW41922.1 aspartate kinase [Kandleria vitulina]SEI55655.1 aspartate kinase [Kandleria vitulina]HAD22831.1 hypothetical protein [Kandleria vitulina]HBG67984.1 hypothetical protein [Kandleria vitulina]HCY52784.1 hypothetical protein [Kandleria vitulina]
MKKGVLTRIEADEKVIQVRMDNVEKNSLFVADIFKTFSKHGVNIDMISSVNFVEELRIDFTCDEDSQKQLNEAIQEVNDNHPRISIHTYKNVGKLVVEGEAMRDEPGVAAEIFDIFGQNQIPFSQVTTSEISISFVLHSKYIAKALEKIKEAIE